MMNTKLWAAAFAVATVAACGAAEDAADAAGEAAAGAVEATTEAAGDVAEAAGDAVDATVEATGDAMQLLLLLTMLFQLLVIWLPTRLMPSKTQRATLWTLAKPWSKTPVTS